MSPRKQAQDRLLGIKDDNSYIIARLTLDVTFDHVEKVEKNLIDATKIIEASNSIMKQQQDYIAESKKSIELAEELILELIDENSKLREK